MKNFKTFTAACLLLLLSMGQVIAQNFQDVAHLRDRGVIRGTIVEERPGTSIIILTGDGSTFVVPFENIERLTRESVRGAVTIYQDVVHLRTGGITRGKITERVPGVSVKIETLDGNSFVFPISGIERITREETTNRAFAQSNFQDAVHLKNGGITRGAIIQEIPNESVIIQTGDGSSFVHNWNDIEKITHTQVRSASGTARTPSESDGGPKRFWVGAAFGPSITLPTFPRRGFWEQYAQGGASFEAQITAEIQLSRVYALGTGFFITGDKITEEYSETWFGVRYEETYTFRRRSLQIPIYSKWTIRPQGTRVSVEPFAGMYFNIGGREAEIEIEERLNGIIDYIETVKFGIKPPVMGLTYGLDFGIKAGPGFAFFNTRYDMDLGSFYIDDRRFLAREELFHRGNFVFGLGYKIGFGSF